MYIYVRDIKILEAEIVITYISFVKISSLNHEILDNTVKGRTFVTKALLSCKEKKKYNY